MECEIGVVEICDGVWATVGGVDVVDGSERFSGKMLGSCAGERILGGLFVAEAVQQRFREVAVAVEWVSWKK